MCDLCTTLREYIEGLHRDALLDARLLVEGKTDALSDASVMRMAQVLVLLEREVSRKEATPRGAALPVDSR